AAAVRARPGVSMEQQKRIALLRLVSVILGVNFDDLRQREQERARKQRRAWAALAAALVLAVAGGGLLYWDLMRPKTHHYRQLVWRWGTPEGLGKIGEETRSHLAVSYVVKTQRTSLIQSPRVVEVRREKSGGALRATEDGYARWVIHYSENGLADRVEAFDETDQLAREEVIRRSSANVLVKTFERDSVPLTQSAAQNLVVDPLNTSGQGLVGKSEITRHQLTLDGQGFTIELRYQDYWGTPRRDAQDSFGKHYSYSPEGQVVRRAEIGPDGAEITLKNGLRAVTFDYDRDYKLIRHILIGTDGKPFASTDGFASYAIEYDLWGNPVAVTYYGADGKPALNRSGYAKITIVFDAHGNSVEASLCGADGAPTLHKDGHAKVAWMHDAAGREI